MKRKFFLTYRSREQGDAIKAALKNNPDIVEDFVINAEGLVFGYEDLFEKIDTKGSGCPIVINNSLPIWNHESYESIKALIKDPFYFICSYEMTEWELSLLYESLGEYKRYMIRPVYGYIPMMYTKNCVKKTSGKCNRVPEIIYIRDRKNISFPVFSDCSTCSNIIYNSVPLSLHSSLEKPKGFMEEVALGLDFTVENRDMTYKILSYFLRLIQGKKSNLPYSGFTKSHNKQQVL